MIPPYNVEYFHAMQTGAHCNAFYYLFYSNSQLIAEFMNPLVNQFLNCGM